MIESGVGDFIRMTIETASRQVTIESVQNGFYDMLEFILENVDNSKIIYPSENPVQ